VKGYVFLLVVGIFACKEPVPTEVSDVFEPEPEVVVSYDSSVHRTMEKMGLVDIHTLDTTILIDLRYSGKNNFMETVLYDTLQWLFLQRDVAERVVQCQQTLRDSMPGYSLLLYDGVRPLQVQQKMWDSLDSIPFYRRVKFVSNPAFGSIHNYGAAVDITICDASDTPLDMGAGYDDFREIASPGLEWKFRKSGELSEEQWQNRRLLRWVMKSEGFYNIPSEWWHFNACNRVTAAHKYQQLLTESGDSRWFRVVVKDKVSADSLQAE